MSLCLCGGSKGNKHAPKPLLAPLLGPIFSGLSTVLGKTWSLGAWETASLGTAIDPVKLWLQRQFPAHSMEWGIAGSRHLRIRAVVCKPASEGVGVTTDPMRDLKKDAQAHAEGGTAQGRADPDTWQITQMNSTRISVGLQSKHGPVQSQSTPDCMRSVFQAM